MMKRITFLHPDLGIGGAERLVVDAALALKSKGHRVRILTSHHDPSHAFEETKDGTIPVLTHYGTDFIPRTIFGKGHALLAYIRMIILALWYGLFLSEKEETLIVDQVSACIPVLKFFQFKHPSKIIFYCHFPDQLLSTDRSGCIKKVYRRPLDLIEEKTTGMADLLLVNSEFTKQIFAKTFRSLSVIPEVLYPSLDYSAFDNKSSEETEVSTTTFLSLNRFERKKNLMLAVESFALLCDRYPNENLKLILAGGYDPRVEENVEHYEELSVRIGDLNIKNKVELLRSIPSSLKVSLLKTSSALLYTPSNEHFGIVPLEAMYCGLPVIAVNNGGPTETVLDKETGFLNDPTSENFCFSMEKIVLGGKKLKEEMGMKGNLRVLQKFSFTSFTNQLHDIVQRIW